MQLADFERDGARLRSALNREYYLQRAGFKAELELGAVFDDFPQFRDPELFHEIRGLHLEAPLDEKYRRFLLDFAATCYLQVAARPSTEAIASGEATKTVEWG